MKHSPESKIIELLKMRSVQLAVIFLAFSSLVVSSSFYITFYKYPKKISDDYVVKFRNGINYELEKLQRNGQDVAALPEVVEAIDKEDSSALAKILPWQLNKYGIGIMGAISKDGIILTRTRDINRKGDNFFLNVPLGRAIAESNSSVASVELNSGDASELMLVTAGNVYKNNKKIGALTANYLADDSFASRFAEKYLTNKIGVAFYTRGNGIYGSSFSSQADKKLFSSYFYTESSWVKYGLDNSFVRTSKGEVFLVRNIVFPGFESAPGGALIFIPINNMLLVGCLGAILPVLLFLFLLFLLHRRFSVKEKNNIWCCPFIITFAIFYVFSSLALFIGFFNLFPFLKNLTYPLYNSTLRFQPDSGVFDNRFMQQVSAVVDTGNESINAVRLVISYNPNEIKVQSVNMDRSICKYFIMSEHDEKAGKISVECIIPNPGFKGNNAVVADLSVKALEKTTVTTIHYLDETEVLANDGLATSVLRLASDATLRFEDLANQKQTKKIIIFSPSHPSPERWYSNDRVDLSWQPSFSGIVTEANNAIVVSPPSVPPIHKKVPQDGIYRFIVKAKDSSGLDNTGEIIVKVDTAPPDKVDLKASEVKIKPGGIVRFEASGHDNLSGLQRVFYIKVNNEIFFPIGSEIYIPFPQAGNYNVTLRAYDKAGNYKDVTQNIVVNSFQ